MLTLLIFIYAVGAGAMLGLALREMGNPTTGLEVALLLCAALGWPFMAAGAAADRVLAGREGM